MGAPTRYFYGDSTPSPLETDFIAFFRDAFDFAVAVLLCDARVTEAMQRVSKLSDATESEIARAEAFVAEASRTLDRADVGDRDSLAARCAARIRSGAKELVRAEAEGARAAVAIEKTRVVQATATERDICAKALEALLLRHRLPDAEVVMQIRFESPTHYDAQIRGHTPYGLEWVIALEIPPSHPLVQVLRIDRVVQRLDVDAPEEAGWIHKEVKIRPQRFDRLYLAELKVDPTDTTIKLRVAPDGIGGGFDLSFKHDVPHVRLVRILEGGASTDSPYDVVGEDVEKLRALRDALIAMTSDLAEHKKSLLKASLDGAPIQQLETPRVLVERLIANIAPTVQQISKRSLAPGELVLKRLLGDNHREELFVSKAELARKLEPLSIPFRQAFEPLGLWESHASGPAPAPAVARLEPAKPEVRPQVTATLRGHVEAPASAAAKPVAQRVAQEDKEEKGWDVAAEPTGQRAAPASVQEVEPKVMIQIGSSPPPHTEGPPSAALPQTPTPDAQPSPPTQRPSTRPPRP
jgi:hypothetical protein